MNSDLLLTYLEKVIMEMLETVAAADFMADGAEGEVMQKINNILRQFGVTIEQVMPQAIILDYFGGVDEATAMIQEAGAAINPTLAITPEGLVAQPFQKTIHLRAVEELVDNAMLDMSAAILTAQASAGVVIAETLAKVKEDIAIGAIRGDARKTIQNRVMASFLADGMTSFQVEDKNGKIRNLPLRFYAMTVVRTKSREATVQGSKNRYIDSGHDLVQITGNGDSCETCARYNGLVVSLTGKTPGYPVLGSRGIKLPPYHPNCRCGHRVFILRYASDEEIQEAKKRNKAYKETGDPRTPAQKAAYEDEQRKRQVANNNLKQFVRWQSALGAEAPKTFGAFQRMKRQNTVKFQQLQSEYLSISHTKQ